MLRAANCDHQALRVVVHVLEVESHQLGLPQRPDEAYELQCLVSGAAKVGLGGTDGRQ